MDNVGALNEERMDDTLSMDVSFLKAFCAGSAQPRFVVLYRITELVTRHSSGLIYFVNGNAYTSFHCRAVP